MAALTREFDDMREESSDIECWNAAFWDANSIQLTDWYRVDAWYRSRVLELPRSGPSLVPCIDMANHSAEPNAYYEETPDGDVVLLTRPGANLANGMEITISYGSEKSPAEMLFSYGFLDTSSALRTLTLPLSPFPDDPLGKAKVHIFEGSPSIQIKEVDSKTDWESPFAYLMCLNEEDGLGFQVMQSSDGGRELRLFWQEEDVTETIDSFETLISSHALCDVFRLRVTMVISQRLQEQLERLSEDTEAAEHQDTSDITVGARKLKQIETGILEEALVTIEDQVSKPCGAFHSGRVSISRASQQLVGSFLRADSSLLCGFRKPGFLLSKLSPPILHRWDPRQTPRMWLIVRPMRMNLAEQ